MKRNYQVIKVQDSGKPDWGGGARTYAFVFDKSGNYLVKGYMKEVEKYVQSHFKHYFVNYTLFNGKKIIRGRYGEILPPQRNIWRFGDACGLHITEPNLSKNNYMPRYTVEPWGYDHNVNAVRMTFRRMPNRWLPEFDALVAKYGKNSPLARLEAQNDRYTALHFDDE